MNIRITANLLATPFEYLHDALRAFRWSKASPLSPYNRRLHYDILLLAHTVEKGLSVSKPRKGFGTNKINQLLNFLGHYDERWGNFPMEKAYGCLKSYVDWHASVNFDLGQLGVKIQEYLTRCELLSLTPKGGVKHIACGTTAPAPEFQQSLLSRFSCRRFEPVKVTESDLSYIASVAARTPSQCNRQSSRVHYYSDREKIDQLLRLQGGAEGFRESVYNLFLVSSEMSAWSGVKARSQAYVDGSLTAMQVLNACQSLGLGACPLNLAVTNIREKNICDAGGISRGERLIMMIAFGVPEKVDLCVARSERMMPFEVLINHD